MANEQPTQQPATQFTGSTLVISDRVKTAKAEILKQINEKKK